MGIPDRQEAFHNGRLLAAAPDMHDSLVDIFRYVDRNGYPSFIKGVESVVVNIPSNILCKARASLKREERETA